MFLTREAYASISKKKVAHDVQNVTHFTNRSLNFLLFLSCLMEELILTDEIKST